MKIFTTQASNSASKKAYPPSVVKLGVFSFWIAVWAVVAMVVNQPLFLPSPLIVTIRLVSLMLTPTFWKITMGSLVRILLGFGFGFMGGGVLAVLSVRFVLFKELVTLPMNIIKATPVASFVILATLFIGDKYFSVFFAFLMVLPIVWSNLYQGILSTDKKLLEMGHSFGFNHMKKIKYIYLPSIKPYLLSTAVLALGFAWKSGIAAEVISIPSMAIGTQLYDAKVYLEIPDLFAWTAVIIILSILLEKSIFALSGFFSKQPTAPSN